jgi:pimeloyl-ACP methyl ester carboxylesterase
VVGGQAVLDVAVPVSAPVGEHRNLTAGTAVCPSSLVQVDTGPPLALVADGLDTAIHQLDPVGPNLLEVSRVDRLATSLTTNRHGDAVAAVVSTSYRPGNVHAGPTRGPLRRLTDLRPELRDIRWGVQERLSYEAWHRPAHRRRRRRPRPAGHRRLEPRRVHGRMGDRADRPVQGGRDGSRNQRLENARRNRRRGPFESALGGSSGWEGTGPHRHDRLSPISYASKVHTPVLILHGENDTNVPVSQAEFFHRALRTFEVEHKYVVYP